MLTTPFIATKVALIAGGVALVVGTGLGAAAARAFYTPRLEASELRVSQLGERLRVQNEAVRALKVEADRRAERARKEIAAAAKVARPHELRAHELLTLQPRAGVDRCTAASDLIRQELSR